MTEERRKELVKRISTVFKSITNEAVTVSLLCTMQALAMSGKNKAVVVIKNDEVQQSPLSIARDKYSKKDWNELCYYHDYFTGYSMDQAFDAYNESKHSEEWD